MEGPSRRRGAGRRPRLSEAERSAHETMLALIEKVSGGHCLWLASEGTTAPRPHHESPELEPVRSSA